MSKLQEIEANDLGMVETKFFEFGSPRQPFELDNGASLDRVQVAYETYGALRSDRRNAILVFHALSGGQHAAGINKGVANNPLWTDECHMGWWDSFIGPGRALDTNKYFIICANCLGGCYGSTGPSSAAPLTGRPYGSRFPDLTMADIVRAQMALLDHLGIERVLAAVGGSMGGMLALDMALQFPRRVRMVVSIGSCARTTTLSKLLNFEQIFALESDPGFQGGDYYDAPQKPRHGLMLARMIGHKTYVSLDHLNSRTRAGVVTGGNGLKGYRMRHAVESYMLHQGTKFARRFDANTYIKFLTAIQSFDVGAVYGGGSLLEAARRSAGHRHLIISIDTDVCHYPEEQSELVEALTAHSIDCRHVTVHSEKGHDSFLLEPKLYAPLISAALDEELDRAR